ncbi:MAG: glycoside hydrolase family 57 protein [Acidobacteriota bacterium]|nr:glycoside hydrolase family 57 protein [Blastocatellia bacterium]MDW8238775.1 glycoside hydrolase family 57 protein [Acidobacteriota bacterium]
MKLLLLWHMHQPSYKDYATGQYHLPWAYLHTTKDYYEMPHLIEPFARLRMTFNLTPSLIEAISDYAQGHARDEWLRLFQKPPEQMTEDERQFVREQFFTVDAERYIEPMPRYKELYLKQTRREPFSHADVRDLQMHFHLAWLGESFKRHRPAIRRLVSKQRGYTEDDKQTLLALISELCQQTLSLYQSLWERGKIEVSATPYYHPILPLVCDTRSAAQSTPRVTLPQLHFAYPDDARSQTALAVDCFRKTFGRVPNGFWPAEGGVSHEALVVLSEYGARWAATDESILRRSKLTLPKEHPARRDAGLLAYQPYWYRVGHKEIALFFRDHTLSDLIGFVYQRWNETEAVHDLMKRLRAIHQAMPDAVVSIILDGENAWEHYAANGYDFLTQLYERIDQAEWIEATTFSECLTTTTRHGRLESVHPGSWIGADFQTWIGDEEKNRAWDYLKRAREAVRKRATGSSDGAAAAPLLTTDCLPELTRRSLLAAEGSDWFWWFGPAHSSGQDAVFDALFRTHLKNVYAGLNQPWPAYLDAPIMVYRGDWQRQPTAFMTPRIDGYDSDYFEWLSAGMLSLRTHGSMQRAVSRLSRLFFGFDLQHAYFRVDFDRPAVEALTASRLRLELYSGHQQIGLEVAPGEVRADAACRDIAEIKVPLAALGVSFGDRFELIVIIADTHEIERFPHGGSLILSVPSQELELENWMV